MQKQSNFGHTPWDTGRAGKRNGWASTIFRQFPSSSSPHYSILRHPPHLSTLLAIPPHNIPSPPHPPPLNHFCTAVFTHSLSLQMPHPPHPDTQTWFQPFWLFSIRIPSILHAHSTCTHYPPVDVSRAHVELAYVSAYVREGVGVGGRLNGNESRHVLKSPLCSFEEKV